MTDDRSDDAGKAEFRKRLDALIGQPTGSGKPAVAPDPVNAAMIRHWAYALEDMNPVYLDPEFAAKSRFGGLVSPPVMLQTWTMAPPKITGITDRGGIPIEIRKNPMAFIDEAGFVGTVATNSEFEIERYPRVGEHLSSTTVIEEISDEKRTALGTGHFVTWVTTYVDEQGEVVGRQRFRVLRFKPGA
jgi:hypothetical protein